MFLAPSESLGDPGAGAGPLAAAKLLGARRHAFAVARRMPLATFGVGTGVCSTVVRAVKMKISGFHHPDSKRLRDAKKGSEKGDPENRGHSRAT